mgnify:FL=1
MKIKIIIAGTSVLAELNESPTAKMIMDALPLKASFNTWGDEIYFSIPVKASLDNTAKEIVELGDLGFWPPGSAFCIFFGMTPMSSKGKIIPASAVNIIGRVIDEPSIFKKLTNESEISLEAL